MRFFRNKIILSFLFICAAGCKTGEVPLKPIANLSFLPVEVPKDTTIKQVEISGNTIETRHLEESLPSSVSYTFSKAESMNVRVADKRLFTQHKKFTLDLTTGMNREFVFPLSGAKVISNYGSRGSKFHSGIDLKTKANDTIRAAFSGGVRMSSKYGAYGNVIVIRHDTGLETVYGHNVKNLVKAGDFVRAGQPIALTGRTGRASTEHLHFEVRVNGQYFDPNLLVDFKDYRLHDYSLVFTRSKNGGITVHSKA